MNQHAVPRFGRDRRLSRSQNDALLSRIARRIRDAFVEWHQAQRRLAELATAPDRYVFRPNKVPDTYEEFLFRTSGLLRREPPARSRIAR